MGEAVITIVFDHEGFSVGACFSSYHCNFDFVGRRYICDPFSIVSAANRCTPGYLCLLDNRVLVAVDRIARTVVSAMAVISGGNGEIEEGYVDALSR